MLVNVTIIRGFSSLRCPNCVIVPYDCFAFQEARTVSLKSKVDGLRGCAYFSNARNVDFTGLARDAHIEYTYSNCAPTMPQPIRKASGHEKIELWTFIIWWLFIMTALPRRQGWRGEWREWTWSNKRTEEESEWRVGGKEPMESRKKRGNQG